MRLADEDATIAAGARMAGALRREAGPVVITLAGPLGSGKTTFVRALLRALGVTGAIRSPTYTLLEEHAAAGWEVLHLDLYRLASDDSLHEFGLRDRHVAGTLVLIEWPERAGSGRLPPVDVALNLDVAADGHTLGGVAGSATGGRLLQSLLLESRDESPLSP